VAVDAPHGAILGRAWRGIGPDGKAKQAGGRHIATVVRMAQWPLRADDAVKAVAVVSKENVSGVEKQHVVC
jgi:hypothetical protein